MQTVSSLSTSDLQNLLDQYPWFTIARKEYVRRIGDDDKDAMLSAAADAGIFMLSRKEFLMELTNQKPAVRVPVQTPVSETDVENAKEEKKIYIIGGDYFGKEEFLKLENSGEAFDVDALRHNPIESTVSTMDAVSSSEPKPLDEMEIYTETLANVYAQQGLCDRAITIYEKLILLYPEKSAYFADLIQNAQTIAQTIKQQ